MCTGRVLRWHPLKILLSILQSDLIENVKEPHVGPLLDSLTELMPMFPPLTWQAGSADLILNFDTFT